MDEVLDAADSADQQEAELVLVVAGGALVKWQQRRAPIAGMVAQPLRAARPAVVDVGGAGSAIAATRHTSGRAGWWIPSEPPIGVELLRDRLARSGSRGAQTGQGPAGRIIREAVMLVAAHGAYLNGWRNASPALAPETQKTSRISSRLSATTIRVLPASRFHPSETVKPASWRVSSSTNTIGSLLASVISSVETEAT